MAEQNALLFKFTFGSRPFVHSLQKLLIVVGIKLQCEGSVNFIKSWLFSLFRVTDKNELILTV